MEIHKDLKARTPLHNCPFSLVDPLIKDRMLGFADLFVRTHRTVDRK